MNNLIAEMLGTFILILLGNGVVANVSLKKTLGNSGGWLLISVGWGLAVFVAVYIVSPYSGAHINPAVTLGLLLTGGIEAGRALLFILFQLMGAFIGALAVYLFYIDHYKATDDADAIKGTFCTGPAIRKLPQNFISELIGTFVLVLGVLFLSQPTLEADGLENVQVGLGSIDALPVALLVTAIGISLGGTTGYAINPARDLGPRIAHTILRIPNKGNSDWGYAIIPILGPFTGAALAAGLFLLLVA